MKKIFLLLLLIQIGPSLSHASVTSEIRSNSTEWHDDQNKILKLSDFQGKRLVVTMSYTACKKTCPTITLAALKDLEKELQKKSLEAEFVIFSFDPENDTPQVLAEFRKKMKLSSPHWHFATGGKDETRAIAKTLGLGNYWDMDEHIIHDFKITMLSPDGTEQFLDWHHRDASQLKY
jgi:protein SCO1/2